MIHRFDDALVARLFPFHLVLDSELRIVGHGGSVAKIDPAVTERPAFGDLFRIRTPRIAPEFEALCRAAYRVGGRDAEHSPETPHLGSSTEGSADVFWSAEGAGTAGATYVLEHLASGLFFRMQLLASQAPARLAFIGSPLLTAREQLVRYDLTLSDFAPFDFVVDYLLALRMKDSLIEETTQLASKLEQVNRDLEEQIVARHAADESKDLFLTSMSHEIRTPMNAITGLTSLLLQMDPVTARRQHLSAIETAARALNSLLDGILEFSKLESGTFDRVEEDFNLHSVVTHVVRLFSPIAHDKGLDLRSTIDDDVPRSVHGEVDLFNRVLVNLTQNAIKFTEKGRVEIAVKVAPAAQGVLVRVEVADTGIGIASADQMRVFDRFTQLREAAGPELGGSGLGLAISRKICEMCGGRVGVESTPGQGSLFWFEFPLGTQVTAPSKSTTPERSEWLETLGNAFDTALPILVVDDNEINRSMVIDMIAWLGIETESAVDGEAAIAITAERDFGAILMDIRMPGMDGYETTRTIRERGGHNAATPIIGLSANAFSKDREAGLAAGMSDYLAKPITMNTLVNVLGGKTRTGRSQGVRHALRVTSVETLDAVSPSTDLADFVASSPLLEIGDTSRAIEFLRDFVAAAPATIAKLRQSLDREDFEEVSRQAHSLRGSSLFLGIDALNDLTVRLEEVAERQNAGDVAGVLSRIKALVIQIEASIQTSTASPTNEDPRGSR